MPITPDTPNIDNSPWYKIVEEKAEAWNQFAFDLNLDIDGHFNAWGMEFSMGGTFHQRDIEFCGIRTLVNPYWSNLLPIKGKIVEELIIWFDKRERTVENGFRIRKESLGRSISSVFSDYRKKSRRGGFILEYNNEYCITEILNLHLLGFNNLDRAELSEDGFILRMNYLPIELKSHKKFLELLDVIYKF